MTHETDTPHAILADPWTWDLVEFVYQWRCGDAANSFIDFVLVKGDTRRRLRFYGPNGVELRSEGLGASASRSSMFQGVSLKASRCT
jgi:hypothetical protein